MPFRVILKQTPDTICPHHFEYQNLVAFNTRLDAEIIQPIINHLINQFKQTQPDDTYFVFRLENVEDVMDESVIGRVVTTVQLIEILNTDEFVEQPADYSLLIGCITVTHLLIIQQGIVYDQGLDDEEIEWSPESFIAHYGEHLWRIND